MTRSPYRQLGRFRSKAQALPSVAKVSAVRAQATKVHTAPAAPDLDECLARELLQGLVRSAVARGADPIARLQEFRTLQQTAIAMSQDSIVAQSAERLVRAADLTMQELLKARS